MFIIVVCSMVQKTVTKDNRIFQESEKLLGLLQTCTLSDEVLCYILRFLLLSKIIMLTHIWV